MIINPETLPGTVKGVWASVPRQPGVYFAFHGEKLIYVGSSVDMGRRLRCHNKLRGWPAGTMIRWHLCKMNELTALELDSIARFKPTENRLGVKSVSTCHCNQCGYDWRAKVENPRACTRCKRYDWDEPKKGN